jgi:hypothetical protein
MSTTPLAPSSLVSPCSAACKHFLGPSRQLCPGTVCAPLQEDYLRRAAGAGDETRVKKLLNRGVSADPKHAQHTVSWLAPLFVSAAVVPHMHVQVTGADSPCLCRAPWSLLQGMDTWNVSLP